MYTMTCGHKQEEIGETIAVKSFAKDGSRAVGFPTLCNDCLKRYRKEGRELETEQEQDDWLFTK